VAIRLEVCVLLLQGWPTSQKPRATFLTVLQQRTISHTWAHMKNITPSLPHPRTHICIARFIANITHHQQDNDRTLQGIYCYAWYLVGLLIYNYVRVAWNWAKSRMWLVSRYLVGLLIYNYVRVAWNWAKSRMWLESRLTTSVLLYSVSALNENELVFECILNFVTVNCSVCFEVFKISAKGSAFDVFKIWVIMVK